MKRTKEAAEETKPEAWLVVKGDVCLHLTEEDVLESLRTEIEEDGGKPIWITGSNGKEVLQSSVNAVELDTFLRMLRDDMTFQGQVFEGEGMIPALAEDEHYCATMPTFSCAIVEFLSGGKMDELVYQIQIDPWRPMPF